MGRLLGIVCTFAICVGGCGNVPTKKSTSSSSLADTLYGRVGGIGVLRILVDEWILEVATDNRIQDYFIHADISELKIRLVERLCVLMQGPCTYTGRELYQVHAPFHLRGEHVRAFLEDLEPAMDRARIRGEVAKEVRDAVRGLSAELGVQ